MKPKHLSGYIFQVSVPFMFALFVNFVFEIDLLTSVLLSYLIFVLYLAYKVYEVRAETKYEPIVSELEDELLESQEKWASLNIEFLDLAQYAEKEIKLKNEGLASLKANYAVVEAECKKLTVYSQRLEAGEELKACKWEVTRLQEELTNKQLAYEKEVARLKEQLTTGRQGSESKIVELQDKLTQAGRQVKELQNEVTRLLPYVGTAQALQKEKEQRRLQTSFTQALNKAGDEKIREVAQSLKDLGVSPISLCDTTEKLKRYKEATELQEA